MLGQGWSRDRLSLVTLTLLGLVALAAWASLILQGSSMAMGRSTGAMPDSTDSSPGGIAPLVAFVTAWTVMMAAMMLPSAARMILLYRNASRGHGAGSRPLLRTWIFVSGYLVVWAAVGVPVYIAGQLVSTAIASNMQLAEWAPYGVALVLIAAGAYQFTPLKRICLRTCQSPLAFFMGHWKQGSYGAFRMGLEHGAYCAGCCWGLMAVLVAAGAMGLAWVLLIALVVGTEKLVSGRQWPVLITGSALLGLGLLVALQPAIGLSLRGGVM
jgi:predicted metal-binding membrane protein